MGDLTSRKNMPRGLFRRRVLSCLYHRFMVLDRMFLARQDFKIYDDIRLKNDVFFLNVHMSPSS